MSNQLTARNADIGTLRQILETGRARRLDLIVNAAGFHAQGGQVVISGDQAIMNDDGVTSVAGTYQPTAVFDEGVAEKLGINLQYVRRMRELRPDLWDANVNGWLHGLTDYGWPEGGNFPARDGNVIVPPDPRSFLLRLFRADDASHGVARAMLSDKYAIIDNLDVLVAALTGIRDAGVQVQVDSCDLTDRRMYVRVRAPEVAALAPGLLGGYRNPFPGGQGPAGVEWDAGGWAVPDALAAAAREGQGYAPGTEPVVFAGFVIRNSEVGQGGFSIRPEIRVRVCKNGLTLAAAFDRTHLGARQEQGVINWSQDTIDKELSLIAARTRDTVAGFLNTDWLERQVAELTAKAGVPVTDAKAVITEVVAQSSSLPKSAVDDLLGFFWRGGQETAGGVMQAATAFAQTVGDADDAYEIQAEAEKILASAARVAARA